MGTCMHICSSVVPDRCWRGSWWLASRSWIADRCWSGKQASGTLKESSTDACRLRKGRAIVGVGAGRPVQVWEDGGCRKAGCVESA